MSINSPSLRKEPVLVITAGTSMAQHCRAQASNKSTQKETVVLFRLTDNRSDVRVQKSAAKNHKYTIPKLVGFFS